MSSVLALVTVQVWKAYPQDNTSVVSGVNNNKEPDSLLASNYYKKANSFSDDEAGADSAIYYFRTAVVIFQSLGDWQKAVKCFNGIGENYWRKRDFKHAREFLNQALQIRDGKSGGDIEYAKTYNLLGIVGRYEGNNDQAIRYHKLALNILVNAGGEMQPALAESYNELAYVYLAKGEYGKALNNFEKSLSSVEVDSAETKLQKALSYTGIANTYMRMKDYSRARQYYKQALLNFTVIRGEHKLLRIAGIYNNLGNVFLKLDSLDLALEYQKKALMIKKRYLEGSHPALADSYNNIGNVYYYQKQFDNALLYYKKALRVRQKRADQEPQKLAYAYINIGLAYKETNEDDNVLINYYKALDILIKAFTHRHPDVASFYNDIGDFYEEKGKYELALKSYQEAICANIPQFDNQDPYVNPALGQATFSKRVLLLSLHGKAETFKQRFIQQSKDIRDLQTSLSNFDLATGLIDKVRHDYSTEDSKLLLGESAHQVYEGAIESSLLMNELSGGNAYQEKAFSFAEKSKISVLWEALSEAQAKKFANIPDSLLGKEEELRLDLADYDTRLMKEKFLNKQPDSLKIIELESHFFELNRQYAELIGQLEKHYPEYYKLKYQSKSVSVKELQDSLMADESVIEYFAGDTSIFIFVVAKEQFNVISTTKDSLFRNGIDRLHESIIGKDYGAYCTNAYRLYQDLFKPVEHLIKTEKVVIIPDGSIYYVPFEALLTDDVNDRQKQKDYRTLPYLLQTHTISYTYSINLLPQIRFWSHNRDLPKYDFLAFAPVFSDQANLASRSIGSFEINRETDSDPMGARIPLPATKSEVLNIQKEFIESYGIGDRFVNWLFGEKVHVFLEDKANEHTLKIQDLKNYRYVHFATHGFVNKASPNLSGLLLAQADTTTGEDGNLYLGEIYNLDLNADLVVLSACETGIGKFARGEGLIGLTRGFLYAGAKNLLVSLWKVNDWSTSDLMGYFYAAMLKGKDKDEALKTAKIKLMNSNSEYAQPAYWSPFILIGE